VTTFQEFEHLWPGAWYTPDLPDDALQLRHGAIRGVVVRRAQLGGQEMLAAEDVQGQIAEFLVIAVEEAALLMAVRRIVGGVQVQDDLRWRLAVGLQEQLDEESFDGLRTSDDLLIAAVGVGLRWRQLQAIKSEKIAATSQRKGLETELTLHVSPPSQGEAHARFPTD
jgi:hypothetical protein